MPPPPSPSFTLPWSPGAPTVRRSELTPGRGGQLRRGGLEEPQGAERGLGVVRELGEIDQGADGPAPRRLLLGHGGVVNTLPVRGSHCLTTPVSYAPTKRPARRAPLLPDFRTPHRRFGPDGRVGVHVGPSKPVRSSDFMWPRSHPARHPSRRRSAQQVAQNLVATRDCQNRCGAIRFRSSGNRSGWGLGFGGPEIHPDIRRGQWSERPIGPCPRPPAAPSPFPLPLTHERDGRVVEPNRMESAVRVRETFVSPKAFR